MVPLVSVILPAYRAEASIGAAVRSVLAAGLPEDQLEILLESDDGQTYAPAAALSPAVRVQVAGCNGSGPGACRNRAMARARGRYLAFLDADDLFLPGYLSSMLASAQQRGASAAPLLVHEDNRLVLALWQQQAEVGFADLAASGASLRLLVARERCPPFVNALAQDILHAVQVMAHHGGQLPLGQVGYILCQTAGSVTGAADFSQNVALAYHAHIASLRADPAMPAAAAAVFEAKLALNAAYMAEGQGQSYYRFIAARQAAAAKTA